MNPMALFGGRPGVGEVLVVVLVLVLLFGAAKLPELARALGRSINEFKKGREEGTPDKPSDTQHEKDRAAPGDR